SGNGAKDLKKFFNEKRELGYNLKAVFGSTNNKSGHEIFKESLSYLESNHNIDEIYCAIDELSEKEINEYVKYANINHCNIKFIPNTRKLFTKRLQTDYYSYLPVLSIQEGKINSEVNKFIKRSFDIIFSLFFIIFILSWLSIIL